MSECTSDNQTVNATAKMVQIAHKIREAREFKGITQVAMAKSLGVARQTYLDLESGKTEPRILMLLHIAEITGRSLHWFIYDDHHGEYGDINRLSLLYTQLPSPLRQRMINHNIDLLTTCLAFSSNK